MTITAAPLEDEESTPTPTPRTDTLAAEGVVARIQRFAETDYRRVVAGVALWSGSTDDAADAVADALGRAWEKLDNGDSIDNLAAFVTTCAMNLLRSMHRRRALFRRKRHLLVVTDRSESIDATARRVDVAAALHHLSHRQRQVVALRYGADLGMAEIAARLGVAEGTVKATLHQARSALADRLGDQRGDDDD